MKQWRNEKAELTLYDGTVYIQDGFEYPLGQTLSFGEFFRIDYKRIFLKSFTRHTAREVVQAIRERRHSRWTNGRYRIEIVPPQCTFCITDRFGGTGETIDLIRFVAGDNQNLVSDAFGEETLREALEQARKMLKEPEDKR